jgi:hypothetical protein
MYIKKKFQMSKSKSQWLIVWGLKIVYWNLIVFCYLKIEKICTLHQFYGC